MDDRHRQVLHLRHVVEQLATSQESVVEHVVALEQSKRNQDARRLEGVVELGRVGERLGYAELVPHEGLRRSLRLLLITAAETLVVGAEQILPLSLPVAVRVRTNVVYVTVPRLRVVGRRVAILEEVVDLSRGEEEDAAQDEGLETVRVSLSVRDAEGGSPATSEDHVPLIHAEMLSEHLDVLDKLLRVVARNRSFPLLCCVRA
mmetsp:Transcript_70948/g.198965  ORF Transcript_70948/g.198965 Transcript_70948/m.198965 type:complete len:204 (+) Transcript_70948:616-1227(+)